jgi:hypothetical protein
MSDKFLLNTVTGEIRRSAWQNGGRFWWTEGNASCDCNRAIAFEGSDNEETPCGDSLYELVNEDGTPYTDWPEDDE